MGLANVRLLLALALPLAACGQMAAATHLSSSMHVVFKTTGQKFFISSQCSPHSLSYELAVNSDSLVGHTYNLYGFNKTQTLDLNGLALTVETARGQTGPVDRGPSEKVVLLPGSGRDEAAYLAALADLRTVVSSLKDGNVCFEAKPELDDVQDFLARLPIR